MTSVRTSSATAASFAGDGFGRVRHDRSLSQDDLAYEAGVSRSYLSQIEKGSYYASLKIIERLSGVLRVEPAELLQHPRKRK